MDSLGSMPTKRVAMGAVRGEEWQTLHNAFTKFALAAAGRTGRFGCIVAWY